MIRIISPRRLSLLLLAACGLTACSMIDRLSGVSETKNLQSIGIAAEATVLRIWDTGITVNQDPVIGMEVELKPAEGQPWRATIPKSLISRLDVPRFQPGQSVSVRYDPHDTSRVALDVYHYK
jgi:hypothetical protein